MKKTMYRFVILGTTILLSIPLTTSAQDFEKHPLKNGIKKSLNRNIIFLDNNNNFYPNNPITRAELAFMVSKSLNLQEISSDNFKDVLKNHPYYKEILMANKAGIIHGYGTGDFKPDKPITREELAVIMFRYIQKTTIELPFEKKEVFKDISNSRYPQIVQGVRNYKLLTGYADNTFKGKKLVTRAEAASAFIRLIETIEMSKYQDEAFKQPLTEETEPVIPEKEVYFVQTAQGGTKQFYSYVEAYNYFKDLNETAYIGTGNTVFDINTGIARTKAFSLLYKDGFKDAFTYIMAGSELKINRIDGNKVYVNISNSEFYLNKDSVNILPITSNQDTSHYINQNGYLYHRIYTNGSFSSYQFGKSPEFMEDNIPYRSFEGNKIAGRDVIQYFNYLPLRTTVSYTGAQLDSYIKTYSPNSPLIGYGQVFVDAANKYKINPMYLLANAIHESGWGTSKIARDKKNLFGFKAYDSDAYGNAASFKTLKEGIYFCAKYISERYLTSTSWAYQGAILGNKSIGMNVKYASDPFWGQKIAGHMFRMDNLLGGKEHNKYLLGIIEKGTPLYTFKDGKKEYIGPLSESRIVAKVDNVQTSSEMLIRLFSDDIKYNYIYVSPKDFKEIKTY